MKPSIGIIDYGIGNWKSISNAFNKIGCRSKVYKNPELLVNSDFLVLPGVGAFKPAMKLIKENTKSIVK